jgi:transposase-like protein
MAAKLIMDAKKGISSKQIQQHLGIGSYQTAWHLTHPIREAMEDKGAKPMGGIVEMDETYIGGTAKRRNPKKPRAPKDMVIAMRERALKGKKDGRVRYFHVPDGKKQTITALVEQNINPYVDRIYTDDAAVYDFSLNSQMKTKHRRVNHSIQWIVPGSRIHINTVESSFSLLKRGLIGSFHRVSTKHLQRYLNEFEYRFNERHSEDRFSGAVSRMCATPQLPYRTLVDGKAESGAE